MLTEKELREEYENGRDKIYELAKVRIYKKLQELDIEDDKLEFIQSKLSVYKSIKTSSKYYRIEIKGLSYPYSRTTNELSIILKRFFIEREAVSKHHLEDNYTFYHGGNYPLSLCGAIIKVEILLTDILRTRKFNSEELVSINGSLTILELTSHEEEKFLRENDKSTIVASSKQRLSANEVAKLICIKKLFGSVYSEGVPTGTYRRYAKEFFLVGEIDVQTENIRKKYNLYKDWMHSRYSSKELKKLIPYLDNIDPDEQAVRKVEERISIIKKNS